MRGFKELLRIRNPFYSTADDRLSTEFRSVERLLRIYITWGGWKSSRANTKYWQLNIQFGRGAGYILGRTIHISRNMREPSSYSLQESEWPLLRRFMHRFRHRHTAHVPLIIGFTQNANTIPYGEG